MKARHLVTQVSAWWGCRSERTRRLLINLGVLGCFILITLLVTWPLSSEFSQGMPGYAVGDQPQKVWQLWHFKEMILRAKNPAFFPLLAYPDGHYSVILWATPVILVLSLPLSLLFASPIVVYNLIFALSYVASGYSGYLLCYDIVRKRWPALFGGLVIMLFPSRVAHALAGHIETGFLFFSLLYMMMLRRMLYDPSPRLALVAGLFLGLASIVHLTALPYHLVLWTAVYLLYFLATHASGFFDWTVWRALLLMGGCAVLVVAPFLTPFIQLTLSRPEQIGSGGVAVRLGADMLSYISPSPDNSLIESLGLIPAFARDTLRFAPQEVTAYLGAIPVAFASVAYIRKHRESRVWLLILFAAAILALGPYLKRQGHWAGFIWDPTQRVVMPYFLLGKLPLFKIGGTPGRFNILTGIALGVLAAQGMAIWLHRARLGWRYYLLPIATVILIVEYLVMWPVQMLYLPAPAAVQFLAHETPTGAVLDVPIVHPLTIQHGMHYQITHRWPLLGGYVIREVWLEAGLMEMFDWITSPTPQNDIVPPIEPDLARALLYGRGVRYVLLNHRFTVDVEPSQGRLKEILGEPVVTDNAMTLYRVEAAPPSEAMAYGLCGVGWGALSQLEGQPTRQLNQTGELLIYAAQQVVGTLHFYVGPDESPQYVTVALNESEIGGCLVERKACALPEVKLQAGYNVIVLEIGGDCQDLAPEQGCPEVFIQHIRFDVAE